MSQKYKKIISKNIQAIEKINNFAEKFHIFVTNFISSSMITKNRRLAIIQELVNMYSPNSQGKLLKLLHDKGFAITQTTLSRDIKQLKISKMPDDKGNYAYKSLHHEASISNRFPIKDKVTHPANQGFISYEFSYQFCVIKTRSGYSSGIATDINNRASSVILSAIAGDNTVLLIPKEGITREEILDALTKIIPGIKKEGEELKKQE
jgi:transcriptional regulator of arginine metabolism